MQSTRYKKTLEIIQSQLIVKIVSVALVTAGFAAVFGSFLAYACYYIDILMINPNESCQIFAALEAFNSKIPGIDFASDAMPLPMYINGAILKLTGSGLTQWRIINCVWIGLSLTIMIITSRVFLGYQGIKSWGPGLAAAFMLSSSPHWVTLQISLADYALAGLFVAVALAAVLIKKWPTARLVIFAISSALALGCRPETIVVLVILAIIMLMEASDLRRRCIVVSAIVGAWLVVMLPFVIADGSSFFYFAYGDQFQGKKRFIFFKIMELWTVSPAGFLVLIVSLFGLGVLVRSRNWTALLLLLAGLLGVIFIIVPPGSYGHAVVPVAIISVMGAVISFWSAGAFRGNPFRHVIWVLSAIVFAYSLPSVVFEGSVESDLIKATKVLNNKVKPGPILTASPMIAVYARREVLPGTEAGMYSIGDLEEHHLVTLEELEKEIGKKIPAAVVLMRAPMHDWNFRWKMPGASRVDAKNYKKFRQTIYKNYRRIHRSQSIEVRVRRK